MVARNIDADVRRNATRPGLLQRFLTWWRWRLSALANRSRVIASAALARITEDTKSRALVLRSPALAALGCAALLIGSILTIALSGIGEARSAAILAAAMSLVWGGLRWAILRLTATGPLRDDPRAIRGAWALGSLVWVVGVTPELRGVAWAVSGVVTWLVLERVGATRRQAGVSVTIAWGMQAFVVLGSWLAQNALIAILATRG